jgi:hypothetical protein
MCLAALLASALMTQGGVAAVGNDADLSGMSGGQASPTTIVEHQLDVEMTVHGWVLCASQEVAEKLVDARSAGSAEAVKAFANLKSARSCGRLSEMHLILQAPLYEALLDSGESAKVYSALVNISGDWASGFVVYGGLPTDPAR